MPEQTPATTPTTTTTTPAPETRAETNREIRALAETFGLGDDFANDLIDRGATEADARSAALDALRARQSRHAPTARHTQGPSGDSPEAFVRAAGEALYVSRVAPRAEISDQARQYAHMSAPDLARACLTRSGIATTGLSPATIIERALHSTSVFPHLLGDAANRTLRGAYEVADVTVRTVARQTTAADFRSKTSIQLGEAPMLEKVNEHGEFTSGTMAEAKETYRLHTSGKVFGVTRQALVNNDLGGLTDMAAMFGRSASEYEAQTMVDLLVQNAGLGPVMDDGNELFDAAHANVAGAGGTLSEATLNAARLAMRRQTGLSGRPINVTPAFLLVPPELELTAEKLLAAIQPATSDNVNPFAGRLQLLVEARLTDASRWYVVAPPAQVAGLEFAYLAGAEGPQIETRAGFEIDGVQTRVRLDFGCAFLDWRGWYSNAGA
jgi:hypothetical protein